MLIHAGILPTPEDQAIMDEKIGTALDTAEHVHEAQVHPFSPSEPSEALKWLTENFSAGRADCKLQTFRGNTVIPRGL